MTDSAAKPDTPPLPSLLQGLVEHLRKVLQAHPEGLDEYTLVRRLAIAFPASLFADSDALRDPLKLFRVHFLLFHTLYRLADAYAAEGRLLRIGTLHIALEVRPEGEPALQAVDPLRAYYLDWKHWSDTGQAEVEQLLEGFWKGLAVPDAESRAAHSLFGLEPPVDNALLRRRYRELVRQHHPDKGGDTAMAQQINAAYLILKRYYRIS